MPDSTTVLARFKPSKHSNGINDWWSPSVHLCFLLSGRAVFLVHNFLPAVSVYPWYLQLQNQDTGWQTEQNELHVQVCAYVYSFTKQDLFRLQTRIHLVDSQSMKCFFAGHTSMLPACAIVNLYGPEKPKQKEETSVNKRYFMSQWKNDLLTNKIHSTLRFIHEPPV